MPNKIKLENPITPVSLTLAQDANLFYLDLKTFIWRNTWAATPTTYGVYDVVYYNGSSYVNKTGTNTSTNPASDTTNWDLMVQKGDTGATGAKGDKGDKGDTGSTGLKGDTGSAGADGVASASAPLSYNSSTRVISLLNQSDVVANNTSTTSGYTRVRVNSQGVVTYADGGFQPAVSNLSSTTASGGALENPLTAKQTFVSVIEPITSVFLGDPAAADAVGRIHIIRNSKSTTGTINVFYNGTSTTNRVVGGLAQNRTCIVASNGSSWFNLGLTTNA